MNRIQEHTSGLLFRCITTALACATLTVPARESEIWISPLGPANTSASGTPSDPFRCPDASSLNTVLTTVLTANNLTLHLLPGTFLVASNGIVPRPGWKIRGAGIDNTVLTPAPATYEGTVASQGTAVVGGYGMQTYSPASGVEISDLTIDCNFTNQSGLARISAVGISGSSDMFISRVKAVNWGTRNQGAECLVLYIIAPDNLHATNCVVEDCIVTQPAQLSFADGATAIHVSNDGAGTQAGLGRSAIVRNNQIRNVSCGGALASPTYFHAITAVGTISRNHATDLTGPNAAGVYQDTGNARDVIIEGNVFDNVKYCIFYAMTSYNLTDVVIKDNVFRPAEGGVGIVYYTGEVSSANTNAFARNLAIMNNVIYPSASATNATALSLNTYISCSVMNNILQSRGNGYDFYANSANSPTYWSTNYPHGLQLKTWTDNVNFSGTQLLEGDDNFWQPGDQDCIRFTPDSAGWYRVASAAGYMAASVSLYSELWNNYTTDTEFWFRVSAYTSNTNYMGELGVSRRGSYFQVSSGQVTAARIVSDDPSSNMVYLDVYVPTVSASTREIRVTSSGPYRSRLIAQPTRIVDTPSVYKQINF